MKSVDLSFNQLRGGCGASPVLKFGPAFSLITKLPFATEQDEPSKAPVRHVLHDRAQR